MLNFYDIITVGIQNWNIYTEASYVLHTYCNPTAVICNVPSYVNISFKLDFNKIVYFTN